MAARWHVTRGQAFGLVGAMTFAFGLSCATVPANMAYADESADCNIDTIVASAASESLSNTPGEGGDVVADEPVPEPQVETVREAGEAPLLSAKLSAEGELRISRAADSAEDSADFKGFAPTFEGPESAPWRDVSSNIKSVSFDEGVAPTDMSYWFASLGSLRSVSFEGLDSSRTVSLKSLFEGCTSLETLNPTCLDTSSVIDFSCMFSGCSGLRELDLSGFDTSKAVTARDMLQGCSSLAAIDASSFTPELMSESGFPEGNGGGFWYLKLPEGYACNAMLRTPTEREKATTHMPVSWLHDSVTGGFQAASRKIVSQYRSESTKSTEGVTRVQETGNTPLEAVSAPLNESVVKGSANEVAAKAPQGPKTSDIRLQPIIEEMEYLNSAADVVDAAMEDAERAVSKTLMPLSIPLNLFATTILLVVALPATLLLIRDHRA